MAIKYVILLLFAKIENGVRCERGCIQTEHPPKVLVADAEHLSVDWSKSFTGCGGQRVKSALVEILRPTAIRVQANFADKKMRVRANPCLKQLDIKVKLLLDGRTEVWVWSHAAQYNDYGVHPNMEEFYSGLLRKPIHDKICDRSVNDFPMSDVPDNIKMCVHVCTIERAHRDKVIFKFSIVDPSRENKNKTTTATFEMKEHCPSTNTVDVENSNGEGGKEALCRRGKQGPEVSVHSATHLQVFWKDSFEDCDPGQIRDTNVYVDGVGAIPHPLLSNKMEAVVYADPCKWHRISVALELNRNSVIRTSLESFYNADLTIESIFSGLLKGKFSEQLCAKSNKEEFTASMVPEIPKEINKCVQKDDVKSDGPNRFTISISNPKKGQGERDITIDCENPSIRNVNAVIPTIIGMAVLIIALVPVLVVYLVCRKKKQDRKADIPADVNPVYEGAADYDYDEMNYDTMGNEDGIEVTVKKKEVTLSVLSCPFLFALNKTSNQVKAEAVDRSSVYGEEEQGWEDAVAVDVNPTYDYEG